MNIITHIDHRIIEIPEFLPVDFCQDVIARAESIGFERAKITTPGGQVERLDIRDNYRVFFKDFDLAKDLFQRLPLDHISPFGATRATGLNELFRIYRYDPGQQFDWHQDGFYQSPDGFRSRFTFMVYLNACFSGGGTSFADWHNTPEFEDFAIVPDVGKALLFYHPIGHRGDPIIEGRKYVLRTDVMYELKPSSAYFA